ncbi:MAG: GntR family transcriptional regulator [Chloroflexi bacterium]|nr:GntR family transcriptional regulator [Chloroflexota bacterium]
MTDSPSLGLIQNKSLREHVLEMLRNAIVNGELKPGQTLVEADLASQLGVSRAPLREAINILNAEGLLETVPYHGTTVTKLARKDIEDLYSIRSLMEGFAVQRLIALGQAEVVAEQLRDICADMMASADEGNLREVNFIDRHFHDTLVASSQNELLVMLWGMVSLRVRQVMSLRNQKKGNLHEIGRNHLAIVDAIAAEDTDLSVQLLHHHIGSTGDLIAEGWEKEDDGARKTGPLRSLEEQKP